MRPPTLFSEGELNQQIEATQLRLIEAVRDVDEDALLRGPEQDIVQQLTEQFRFDIPHLKPAERSMTPIKDTVIEMHDFGEVRNVRGKALTVHLPFDGDPLLLKLRPSSFELVQPSGSVVGADVTAEFEVRGKRFDAAELQVSIDRWAAGIEKWLGWVTADLQPVNDGLPKLLASLVRERRDEVLEARSVEAALNIPVRRVEGSWSGVYSIPTTRKRVGFTPSATATSKPFEPEPALAIEDFEAAVELTLGWARTIERTPGTGAKLGEEELRDLLLGALNSHFMGAAGGELFNGHGKTDVLIRNGNRNVFIGECKFWSGPANFGKATDQLLNYLVWRDTKAAMLLFIRQQGVSRVIERARSALREHPQFRREMEPLDPATRCDFEFAADGDDERRIHLVLFPCPYKLQPEPFAAFRSSLHVVCG